MTREEKLMAFADGELTPGERRVVEKALSTDQGSRGVIAQHHSLRRDISKFYDSSLAEAVPERLTRLLIGVDSNIVPLRRPASRLRNSWWQNVAAVAASLVIGIMIGPHLVGDTSIDGSNLATGELAQALDVQLAAAQDGAAPVQVGISFLGPEGSPCRTFQSASSAGLACRSGKQWHLMLLAPAQRGTTFEYQQAASGTALVMASAQELMAGEPMTSDEERRARDAGWVQRGRRP